MADGLDVSTIEHMTSGYKQRTIIVFSICYSFAAIAVVLRFVCRWISKNKFWWDDWLVVLALSVTTGFCACALASLPSDAILSGDEPLDAAIAIYNTKASYTAELFYYINQASLKLSILAFYWRVFSASAFVNKSIRYIGAYVIIWFIACFIVAALQCVPVEAVWDPVTKLQPGVRCVDLNAFFFGTSVPNIVADFVLLVLPVPQVLRLNISNTQKGFVLFFFMLGGFVVITSIVRLQLLFKVDFETFAYNWSMENSVLWTIIENNCGVISVCLPSLRPLTKIMPWSTMSQPFSKSYSGSARSRSGTHGGPAMFGNPPHQGYWSEIRSTNDATPKTSGIRMETKVDVESIELSGTRNSSQDQLAGSAMR